MRTCISRAILLVIAVFLATCDAASKPSKSDITTENSHPTTRLLRGHRSTNNENDEERGVSIPNVEKLDDWLQAKTSTDGVFKLLALDNAAENVLGSPQLNAWISYMKLFNGKNPTNKASLIATLTAHYGYEALAKMIEAAKKVPTTARFAKRVQTELAHRWLVAGKTPDDVFTLLKLDEAGSGLFAQPQTVTWAKYMDDFNKANPESRTTLFSALKKRYKNEATLVGMLIAAEKVPSTKSIATRAQAELTQLWVSEAKAPADVFKLLKLDDVGVTVLKNPLFSAWVKYTDDFRTINFGTKLTTIAALRVHYRDDVLAKMIVVAAKSSSTSDIAKRLHTELVREWYIRKFAPKHVFKLLRLDKAGEKLFESPLFGTWTNFMVYFSNLNPTKDVTLLTNLETIYGEQKLSKLLVAAWNVPRTKRLATELQSLRLDRWLTARKDPVGVFYSLGALADDLSMQLYKNYRSDFDRLRKSPVRNKP